MGMIMIYRAKMPEAYARVEWCKKIFGETNYDQEWWRDRGYVCFRNKQDYMLYLLKWA
jgi:hypothetical protein